MCTCDCFRLLTLGPAVIVKDRLAAYKLLMELSPETKAQNEAIHRGLPESCREVLKGKNLGLWQRLVDLSEFPDKEVVRDACRGTELSGSPPASGHFRTEARAPELLPHELDGLARWLQHALLGSVRSSGSQELDESLIVITKGDVEAGGLRDVTRERLGQLLRLILLRCLRASFGI